MGRIVLDWYIFGHNIAPFISAQLFLVVLIYFTLVRERIKKEYLYYMLFLVSFIIYLASTLINILPIQKTATYIHYTGSFLLFSVGFPSLTIALFSQSNIRLPNSIKIANFTFGSIWFLFYLTTSNFRTNRINFFNNQWTVPNWVNFENVFSIQIIVIFLILIIPGAYLLTRLRKSTAKPYIYGMLSLAIFAVIGISLKQWAIYYIGSSLCAIAWGWAMFKDIRDLNNQAKAYHAQQKNLASAQYASIGNTLSIADLYPETIDEHYPFREREELLEGVRTASAGLLEPRARNMANALYAFSQQNHDVFKARIREVIYLLVDTCIYLGGPAKTLIVRLEDKGLAIDSCDNLEGITNLLVSECQYLSALSIEQSRTSGIDALVERMKSYVLTHYHKDDISIDSIASAVGVSRSHAIKSFKNKCGITLNQYLIETRIKKAKSYLLEKPVAETAYEVGFKSANYFSTFFRKHTGITPKQFQQQARGE